MPEPIGKADFARLPGASATKPDHAHKATSGDQFQMFVVLANAGTQRLSLPLARATRRWIPAFAGMTALEADSGSLDPFNASASESSPQTDKL
jgi:hypothetical protein